MKSRSENDVGPEFCVESQISNNRDCRSFGFFEMLVEYAGK